MKNFWLSGIIAIFMLVMNSLLGFGQEKTPPKAVFIGNSITEMWIKHHPEFFNDNDFVNKGISGQTTQQILERFNEDVIDVKPEIVVIGGGINDIAENRGAYNEEETIQNIISMAELARNKGIQVILSSLLPAENIPWNPSVTEVPEKVISLNRKIKDYASQKNVPFTDYYSSLVVDNTKLPENLTTDGLHLTEEGYTVLEKVLMPVMNELLNCQIPVTISLWDDTKPVYDNNLPDDMEKEENSNWVSMVTNSELYIYPAPNPNGTALLMCPGGGYAGLAISHEGKEMAEILNKEGISLAVLKYRMPNGNPEVPQEDVWKALGILHTRGEEWGINPKKIGIGGASAGGHLASTIATQTKVDSLRPSFQFLLYPVITMKENITHQGSKKNLLGENPSQDDINLYSNELNVTSDTPPAFIAVSGDDAGVPVENSLLYYNALRNNGVSSSLHIYPQGGHGWGMRKDFKFHDVWVSEMLKWFSTLAVD